VTPLRLLRPVRLLGSLMMVAGLCSLLWAVVVWRWQDPFTLLYTKYEQHELAARYEKRLATYRPPVVRRQPVKQTGSVKPAATPKPKPAPQRSVIALDALRYRQTIRTGDPLGRIKVPRLGLDALLVTGTDHDSLTKGPGWDQRTYLPGQGQLIYIAGHRTTYSAPFAHIEALRPGDVITIEVPYATFTYEVRWHRIVPSDDLSVLRSHGHELLILQACHPRFFATHRYLAYAVPISVEPRVGKPYTVGRRLLAAAAA